MNNLAANVFKDSRLTNIKKTMLEHKQLIPKLQVYTPTRSIVKDYQQNPYKDDHIQLITS